MATEKKNRIQRDDKEIDSSVDNGNSSADSSASLHARRAKLRGALGAGKATPAYPDPFGAASSFQEPYGTQADPYGAPQDPYQQDPNQDPHYHQEDAYGTPHDPYAEQDPYGAQQDPHGAQQDPQDAQQDVYGVQQDPFTAQHHANPDPFAQYEAPLASADTPVNVYGVPITEEAIPAGEPTRPAEPRRTRRGSSSSMTASPFESVPSVTALTPLPAIPDKTFELVNSIDQSLNVCATNLAALQNLAGEQTEVLKALSQTLQNQTLLEIGLNLNSLTESLTAALEPMKAIGELVPALDSLVSTLEGKEQEKSDKMSPDQLVTNLADQLSAGLIDPWTFKCAYMAVYPADPPAELLHRLVELLGTQRLSGDLFRSAYEAVQAAEAPARSYASMGAGSGGGEMRGIVDENVRAQLDNLERSNRELQKRQEEREQELTHVLAQKEGELQAAQDQLNQRLEELNSRYADAADMISSREEEFRAALESKDMDLIEKDAELNMLRAQMEELRSSTEEMGKALHREMKELKLAATQSAGAAGMAAPSGEVGAVNSQGFFDALPANRQPQPNLFDTAPAQAPKGVFASEPTPGFQDPNYSSQENNFGAGESGFSAPQNPAQTFQAPPNPTFQAPATPSFQPPAPTFQPPQVTAQQVQPGRPGPGPAPPTTPFGGQSGSYGMGVRQQVFEVIVRQALAGAPWREICAGPMQVNNISPDEVESEVKRRQSMLNK